MICDKTGTITKNVLTFKQFSHGDMDIKDSDPPDVIDIKLLRTS